MLNNGTSFPIVYISLYIYDSSCTTTILDWTIADVDDDRVTVDAFYRKALSLCGLVGRQHVAETEHYVEEAKIGINKEALIRIGNRGG